jgi:hypothetical protein
MGCLYISFLWSEYTDTRHFGRSRWGHPFQEGLEEFHVPERVARGIDSQGMRAPAETTHHVAKAAKEALSAAPPTVS